MDTVGTIINAAIVTVLFAVLSWQMTGRFRSLERRMDRLEDQMGQMRSDLTQVALAVGAKPRSGAGGSR